MNLKAFSCFSVAVSDMYSFEVLSIFCNFPAAIQRQNYIFYSTKDTKYNPQILYDITMSIRLYDVTVSLHLSVSCVSGSRVFATAVPTVKPLRNT